MTTPTIATITHWHCPNCGLTDMTRGQRPHTRYHTCPRLHYLSAPMVVAGTKAKVEVHERDDYINGDRVFLDSRGRPVMSIVTVRDNGQDAIVFAPVATGRGEA